MSGQQSKPILVAVGHDPMDAALQYAAGDATRVGCGLHLVHVVHDPVQGPNTVLMERADLDRAGRLALESATEKARDLVGDRVLVTTELVRGRVVSTLVEAASEASAVVLQRRPLSRLERVVTRSVSSGVAARAHVPVISVPARWSPVRLSGLESLVTVGVDVPDRSSHLLRLAVDVARSRDARLRIVHTWSLPGAYADFVMPPDEQARWTDRATAEIKVALAALGDDAPGDEVIIEALHAHPGHVLVERGRSSDLLIVGRHDPLVPFGSHLGPVARAVLREATCPVLLADPHCGEGRSHGARLVSTG